MTPEKKLFQSVLLVAVKDATQPAQDKPTLRGCGGDRVKYSSKKNAYAARQKEIQEADLWIRGRGKDFASVCNLAGICPDFIAEAYLNNKIDHNLLMHALD